MVECLFQLYETNQAFLDGNCESFVWKFRIKWGKELLIYKFLLYYVLIMFIEMMVIKLSKEY